MRYDVVVVGAGNAAMCAALAAEERGAKVLVLEAAPKDEGGGNTRFTAGAIRSVYNGVDDLRALMPDLTDQECDITDFGTYTEDQFFDDMFRVTQYRTDPTLVEILVKQSYDTLKWMRGKGVRFQPIWGRQAFKVDGRFKFWGGLTIEAWGGGPGLVEALWGAAEKRGIDMWFDSRATGLVMDGVKVAGVTVKRGGTISGVRSWLISAIRWAPSREKAGTPATRFQVTTKFCLRVSAMNPAAKIDVHSTKTPIPRIITRLPATLPAAVTGVTSPYPTVVRVSIAHHIASGMLPNASGWTAPSSTYMADDDRTTRTTRMHSAPSTARRSLRSTVAMVASAGE